MEVPVNVVAQAHATLEQQMTDMKDIINRLEGTAATKNDAARLLDIWHQLEHVREVLQALHRGAVSDMT